MGKNLTKIVYLAFSLTSSEALFLLVWTEGIYLYVILKKKNSKRIIFGF